MILNLIKHIITSFYFYILALYLINSVDYDSLVPVFIDFVSRSTSNDFFLNKYYAYWTNFSYLYLFILCFIIFYTVIFYKNMYNNLLAVLSLLLYFILILGLYSYWSSNTQLFVADLASLNFNKLLQNSINKYHPFLFYMSSLPIFCFYYKTYSLEISTRFCLFLYLRYSLFSKGSYYYTLLIFFTLYLGSWWALQEGSWGGWWNWDPSEVFGLVITYFYIFSIHHSNTLTFYRSLKTLVLFFYTYLVIYFLIQLNFGLVSHNFGTRIDWFVSTDFYYVFFLMIFILLQIFLLKNIMFFSKNSIIFNPQNTLKVSSYLLRFLLIISFLIIQFFLSFIFIFNDFFWKLMQLNIFNNLFIWDINTTVVIILILVSIVLISNEINIFLLTLYSFFSGFWILIISTFFFRSNIYYISHMFLFVFIFRSYLSEYSSLVFYDLGFYSYENLNSLVINSSFINSISLSSLYEHTSYIKNFISFLETTPSSQSFTFNSSLNKTSQILNLSTDLGSYTITVFESFSTNLNLIFCIVLGSLIRTYFNIKTIMF